MIFLIGQFYLNIWFSAAGLTLNPDYRTTPDLVE